MTVSSLKVYLIFLKGADASDLFLSISSVRARVTGRSERISSVIQSSWTLREAMTKKGRCSVFRQRPFDVSATTGCCGFFALVRTADFFIAYFGSDGKIGNLRAHPDFTNKTAGRRSSKPGLVGRFRFFTSLPKAPDGSMRQIPETPSTSPFS